MCVFAVCCVCSILPHDEQAVKFIKVAGVG